MIDILTNLVLNFQEFAFEYRDFILEQVQVIKSFTPEQIEALEFYSVSLIIDTVPKVLLYSLIYKIIDTIAKKRKDDKNES